MDELAFKQVRDALEKYNNIGIVVGRGSNLDSMAAALSLYLAISSLNKMASIVSVDDPIVEFSSLVGVNKIRNSFQGEGGDLTVSFPYKEGEIDKASYTLENGYLNIIVKAGEQGLSFNEKDVKFTRSAGAPELLFIVGTPRLTDLGSLFDPAGFKNTMVVNIDNKAENQGFGDVVMASPSFSSVSEIMASLIRSLGFKVDQDIAQNLMQGIQNGTGNFQKPNTTPLAFEMAGFLIRNGASRQAFDQSLTSAFARSARAQQTTPVPTISQAQRTNMGTTFAQNIPSPTNWDQDDMEEPYAPMSAKPSFKSQTRPVASTQPSVGLAGGLEERAQREEKIERKEQPGGQTQNPPEDWLAPKIYKGSTNF